MKKRILCLLLSLLLLLPFLPSFAETTPCAHYPGQYEYEDLQQVTRIAPQIGVDGWVELACPECGQVVETEILLALVPEADHPAASDNETVIDAAPAPHQSDPEPVEIPDPAPDPDPDPIPDQPVRPEAPAQPEAVPKRVKEPEESVKAEESQKTESSAKSEASSQSGGTATAAAEGNSAAQQNAKADPPKAQDVTASVAPQQTGGTAGGGGSTGSAGRKATNTARVNAVGGEEASAEEEKKIRTFPYRRIKMKPKQGIRAEAAGILLWPVYGTPFQSLYND